MARPRPWDIGQIKRFIFFIGPISSIFDYTTFFVMLWVFKCWDPSRASVFQTAWFAESLMTQTLIIHVIRTNRIPFLQSRASLPLTITTLSIMTLGGMVAVFAAGVFSGPRASTGAVLADSDGNPALLRWAHPTNQGLASQKEVDLNCEQ